MDEAIEWQLLARTGRTEMSVRTVAIRGNPDMTRTAKLAR
jgi:hypothetical protein